jgi:hypothetical protein
MEVLIKGADVTVEVSSSGDRAAGGSYAVPSQVQRVHRGSVGKLCKNWRLVYNIIERLRMIANSLMVRSLIKVVS